MWGLSTNDRKWTENQEVLPLFLFLPVSQCKGEGWGVRRGLVVVFNRNNSARQSRAARDRPFGPIPCLVRTAHAPRVPALRRRCGQRPGEQDRVPVFMGFPPSWRKQTSKHSDTCDKSYTRGTINIPEVHGEWSPCARHSGR